LGTQTGVAGTLSAGVEPGCDARTDESGRLG
jgi:hypothetical protein